MSDWEGLPAELLLKIAGFCSHPTALLGVCKAWKVGLEGVVTSLRVKPILPLDLAARFHSLTALDLQECHNSVTPAALESLEDLRNVSLSLAVGAEILTPALMVALRKLNLKTLLLFPNGTWAPITDAHFWLLEGLPVSVMNVSPMRISDFGMAALRGMPMVDIRLTGTLTDAGLIAALQGMQLTELSLSECVCVPENFMWDFLASKIVHFRHKQHCCWE